MVAPVAAAAMLGLAVARAPRPPTARVRAAEAVRAPAGMVYVPGGECWLGSDDPDADEDARPRRRAFVASFYLDRLEVTNAEFQRFRPAHSCAPGEERHPVTNVTYPEAAGFARWVGKRLPTEAEWEKAARGTEGRRYPWGDAWNPARVAARGGTRPGVKAPDRKMMTCLARPSRLQPVGSVPAGASPYGCLDLAGNAWEWVQGFYQGNPQQRLIRGGAVGYGERACRAYARSIEGAGAT